MKCNNMQFFINYRQMQKMVYEDGNPLTSHPVQPICITYIDVQNISLSVHTISESLKYSSFLRSNLNVAIS